MGERAALARKSKAPPRKVGAQGVKRLMAMAAENLPELADLTEAQAREVILGAVHGKLVADAYRAIIAQRIDWKAQREAFVSDKASAHTRRAYAHALGILEEWLTGKGLAYSDLDQGRADEFIRDLKLVHRKGEAAGSVWDADSVRMVVNVASSFYTHLERACSAEIKIINPFRGTRARPLSTWATATIPSVGDLEVLRAGLDPVCRAALEVIIDSGLRIGGLPELTIREDGTFWTITKGKRFMGPQPIGATARKAIKAAELNPRTPFSPATFPLEESRQHVRDKPRTPENVIAILKMRLMRACEKLQGDGKLSTVFSWHDFRHAFAQANIGRGLQWLKTALGHSSISVTEHYLQNTLAVNTGKM